MNAPAEKIVTDVRVLAADVEELVKATAAQSGEKIAAARDRAQTALAHARDAAVLRGRRAAQLSDQYVKDNPWTAVGVSAGIGLLIGFLISRR
jgi:ElaB/YqjD/DUF883 family membrane-anchored ribosome-binding protein